MEHLHSHLMTDPKEIKTFCLAGNARITLVSKSTGARYSYRLRKPEQCTSPIHFVGVLTGENNEAHYTYLGIIKNNEFSRTRKSKIGDEATSYKAFCFFWNHLQQRNTIHNGLEVWHEGRCGKCGRALTVPESIARGIGPDCAAQMGLNS